MRTVRHITGLSEVVVTANDEGYGIVVPYPHSTTGVEPLAPVSLLTQGGKKRLLTWEEFFLGAAWRMGSCGKITTT